MNLLSKTKAVGGCLIWTGRLDRHGYPRQGVALAHRLIYASVFGAIPDGYDVDHICFVPACVNPEHLRALPAQINRALQRSALKTHCKNGHEFTPENTYLRHEKFRGRRTCRQCNAAAVARLKLKKRNAA